MPDRVREQYEAFPYPPRDPRDEAKRLIEGSPSHLMEIDHYVFAGRRDWAKPFRALIAGGGTGDGTIMLAQHLADRGCPADLVYLDLSTAARGIAEARAQQRGLASIRFITASLLDLPRLDLGRFDYVDCCGVLHHLPDPAAGLAILAETLSDDGGIGLMVYGTIGRTGVYHLQEVLRQLAADEPDAARLDLARRLLKQLPATNWFARNPLVRDHIETGDAGLYDLLLHSRDRAYTVPELAELVSGAGLAISGLIEPWRYEPASYLSDGALLKRIAPLDRLQRAAIAELLAGNLKIHIGYVVKAARARTAVAQPDDPDVIPVLRNDDGAALARDLKPGGALTARAHGLEARFALPRLAGPILARIDGQRTVGEIHAALAADGTRLEWEAFKAEFDRLYGAFNAVNRMFLRRAR
ncbi:MAG TPA: class I SAM-dependent methyltransferase [Methylomirabilota bacterium]|nr:class I SAM-dependent methyltransferase [Methylomirabilota bacterium]